mmetsp:Transcript_59034/g.127706  ORF Transcript_59034/g.127706 Transcript_59034/m.127706 type:complete len:209 (+) Transcript_59034:169-795(+)
MARSRSDQMSRRSLARSPHHSVMSPRPLLCESSWETTRCISSSRWVANAVKVWTTLLGEIDVSRPLFGSTGMPRRPRKTWALLCRKSSSSLPSFGCKLLSKASGARSFGPRGVITGMGGGGGTGNDPTSGSRGRVALWNSRNACRVVDLTTRSTVVASSRTSTGFKFLPAGESRKRTRSSVSAESLGRASKSMKPSWSPALAVTPTAA